MKRVHILYEFKNQAWGGGNQFLKLLRKKLREQNRYGETPEDADIILFNSHHNMKEVLKAKQKFQNKTFVQRMGSIFTYARGDKYLDRLVMSINKNVADGTIFQSKWQQSVMHSLGMPHGLETIIINAPDSYLFNIKSAGDSTKDRARLIAASKLNPPWRIHLITTSWSTGDIKGFEVYSYLDEHLDFKKYQFTFVGNSKIKFKNIEQIPPQDSEGIAAYLKNSDIFITATRRDVCSDSLVEAIHCGLPIVARKSGGHPELIKNNGILFNGTEDVIDAINKVASNLEKYHTELSLPSDNDVALEYYNFCCLVADTTTPKRYQTGTYMNHSLNMIRQKIFERTNTIHKWAHQKFGRRVY